MKKTVISLVVSSLVGLAGSLAIAQEQMPASPAQSNGPAQNQPAPHVVDPNVQAQHMAKRLKLTSDRQSQVLRVLMAQRDLVKSVRDDSSLSHQDRHAKMQSIRADSESKIRALLTDDQKATFDLMQQQRRDRQQGRKG